MATLAQTMPESEFAAWQHYAARRMLPWRRMELLLAQVAKLIAASAGVKDAKLSDFLFDPADNAGEQQGQESAAAFFGFAPMNRKDG